MGEPLASAIRRVMVRMAMIDGELHATEVDRIRWNVGRLTGHTPTEAQVRDDAERAQARAMPLAVFLRELRTELSRDGRRTAMQAAYIIATADGDVPEAENELLIQIARGLEISPEKYRALVSPMALARALDGR